jgi:hypothetical protein
MVTPAARFFKYPDLFFLTFSLPGPIVMAMAREKQYGYLLDGLNPERAEIMKRALRSVPEIKSISINHSQGTVQLLAVKDPEQSVRVACEVAGCVYRLKLGRGDLV